MLGDAIFVFGGSQNDDSSIIGEGGPARLYFNDVWRSSDGVDWELMTESAPWEPRAGAATVVSGDRLFLLGGEDGFTCTPLPDCDAPYFNDVWSTVDGADWEAVVAGCGVVAAPRARLRAARRSDRLLRRVRADHQSDRRVEQCRRCRMGRNFRRPRGTPPIRSAVKYDFDATTFVDAAGTEQIITVGGDRETFDFADPDNYLRVDNDVWSFAPPE